MSSFDFGFTAGASQNSAKKVFEGNEIYTVTFDGCEARDIQGVQDPSKTFKVLDIKFSNKDGYFTDTVWEPRETDFEDQDSQYGPNPSNVKSMMLKFKHLIDAVNPTLAAKIDNNEQSIKASDWNTLRQIMIKATDPGKGTETKIKLMKGKNGPTFPGYFAYYDKAGEPRMKTNFIGENIFWKANELSRIQATNNAKPTSSEKLDDLSSSVDTSATTTASTADIDFTF